MIDSYPTSFGQGKPNKILEDSLNQDMMMIMTLMCGCLSMCKIVRKCVEVISGGDTRVIDL